MNNPASWERYLELLADEQLGQLALEDASEFERLRDQFADPPADTLGELLLAIDAAEGGGDIPEHLAARIEARGRAVVGAGTAGRIGPAGGRGWLAFAVAAAILAAVSVLFGVMAVDARQRAERALAAQTEEMRLRMVNNETLLADSRRSVEDLRAELANAENLSAQQRTQLAEAAGRALELAERLASVTSELAIARHDLDAAELHIARLETPVDPTELAASRQKLLEVPGSWRVAWSPFDLPDAPAEQGSVRGDVVWNDELQQGYLRFVGLKPNDPAVEQYQVWVIDERGMEQKVSGGVFNATAAGEVIVPIHPGIDVGRVALFAVTIEEPGGIWVPDLSRRVVVAPREEG
ncbi:MAG: anti-sigma factor [Phycisphaerales bacterium]|nr:anti-sigma factor [Phycisphaerales bacterium]